MIAPKRDNVYPVAHVARRYGPDDAPRPVTPIRARQPTRTRRDIRPHLIADAASPTEPAHGMTRDDAALIVLVLALLGGMDGAASPPPEEARLSARQRQVIRLVARGMTNVQVAEALFISPRTVERHLTTIYNKLGISSRNAATRYALQHGLG